MDGYVFEVIYNIRLFKFVDDEVVKIQELIVEGLKIVNPQLLKLEQGGSVDSVLDEVIASYKGSIEAKNQLKELLKLMIGVERYEEIK